MTPEQDNLLRELIKTTRAALVGGESAIDGRPYLANPQSMWLVHQVNDLTAAVARIEAALAGGTPVPGGGATPEQVEEIVDRQLDEHFGGAVTN